MAVIRLPGITKTWTNFVGIGVWITGVGWGRRAFLDPRTRAVLFAEPTLAEPCLARFDARAFLLGAG